MWRVGCDALQSWNMLSERRRISWVRVIVADLLSLATSSSRECPTSTLSLRRPYLELYMSPKMPANVFRRFFIVSSVSSPWACDWLPCRWNGTLDVGGISGGRRSTDGALLTVLDWEATGNCEQRIVIPNKRGSKYKTALDKEYNWYSQSQRCKSKTNVLQLIDWFKGLILLS